MKKHIDNNGYDAYKEVQIKRSVAKWSAVVFDWREYGQTDSFNVLVRIVK